MFGKTYVPLGLRPRIYAVIRYVGMSLTGMIWGENKDKGFNSALNTQ